VVDTLFIYSLLSSLCLFLLRDSILVGGLFYFCIVVAFLVETPIFFVHFWIPKEHVEAPVSHPVIFASVLLKLGGWVWVASCFSYLFAFGFSVILVILSLVGCLSVCFVKWHTDLKSLSS
jgi:NADH-quinone oxidoreductase subunit M